MSIPRQIWVYWQGSKPDFINYCIGTIFDRSGVKVTLLTPDTVGEYVDDILNPQYRHIAGPAQRADAIRIALLYKYGGMWCDADTIFLKNCAHLFDIDCDVALSKWPLTGSWLNGYILSAANGAFMKACLDDLNTFLSLGPLTVFPDSNSVYFGETLFQRVLKKEEFKIHEIPLPVFIPVDFVSGASKHIWNSDQFITKYISQDTVAIAMNHSQFGDDMRNASLNQICSRKTLLGDVFRYSKRLAWNTKYVLEYEYDKNDQFAPICVKSVKDLFDDVRAKGFGTYDTNCAYLSVRSGDLWDRGELFSIMDYAEGDPSVSVVLARRYDCVKNPFFKSTIGVPTEVLSRDRCVGGKTVTLGNYFNFAHIGKSLTDVLARCPHDADWVRSVWNNVPSGAFERVPYAALPRSIGEIPLVRSFIGRALSKKKALAVTPEMMLLVPWPKGLPEGFNEHSPLYKQPSFRNRYENYLAKIREVMGASDE